MKIKLTVENVIIGLLVVAGCVDAAVTFANVDKSTTLQAHSYNFFQYDTTFNYNNCIMVPVLPDTQANNCNFRPAQRMNVNLNNAACSMALLGWADAQLVNCYTVSQAVQSIFTNFIPTLPAAGYPSSTVLAIVLPPIPEGTPSGPMTTPYLSHSSTVSDGFPVMDMVMIGAEDGANMIDKFKNFPEVFATVASGMLFFITQIVSFIYVVFRTRSME